MIILIKSILNLWFQINFFCTTNKRFPLWWTEPKWLYMKCNNYNLTKKINYFYCSVHYIVIISFRAFMSTYTIYNTNIFVHPFAATCSSDQYKGSLLLGILFLRTFVIFIGVLCIRNDTCTILVYNLLSSGGCTRPSWYILVYRTNSTAVLPCCKFYDNIRCSGAWLEYA